MPKPLPADYLQPDEDVHQEIGRHPLSILDAWFGAFLLAGVAVAGVLVWIVGFRPEHMMPWGVLAFVVIGAGLGLALLLGHWRVATSHYVVTDERVYKAYGRLRFFLLQTTFDKVTDLHVKQSIWGRWRGFGTVRVETAGTGVVFDGVPNPLEFKQTIERAREAFIKRLVKAHKPSKKAPEVAEETLWTGSPVPASLLGGIAAASAIAGYGFLSILAAPLLPIQYAWAPIVPLAVAAFMGWGVYVRYRYTAYLVRSRGVVLTRGWLTRRRVETRYEKVTDVTVYQGILGRIMDFGAITINTAGSNQAPVVFHGVRRPDEVKQIIDGARGA